MRIAEGLALRVNMVYLNHPFPKMEEVERFLELENEQRKDVYPKVEESLCDYLF